MYVNTLFILSYEFIQIVHMYVWHVHTYVHISLGTILQVYCISYIVCVALRKSALAYKHQSNLL